MPTNWSVPTGADVRKVLSLLVEEKSNQNTGADYSSADPYNDAEANRRDDLVNQAVAELRGRIRQAGRVPLSVTAGSVPAESVRHVLNHAAWQLVISTPSLQMVIVTEKGVSAPFAKFYEEACQYFDKVATGQICPVPPTDPCGQDWTTAVSDANPAIQGGVKWGDVLADDTDYDAGQITTSTGGVIYLPSMDMNTY